MDDDLLSCTVNDNPETRQIGNSSIITPKNDEKKMKFNYTQTSSCINSSFHENNEVFTGSQTEFLEKSSDLNQYKENCLVNVLRTPVDKTVNDVNDKSFSSSVFKNNLISSTPITNCNYETPERKNWLFKSSTGNSTYFPVSSPTSSELKLSDCEFFNDSSSVVCHQQSKLNFSSDIKETNKGEELNGTVFFSTQNDKFNSVLLDCGDDNDIKENYERTFSSDNNCSVNLKFKSFDLLPGIMPLNDD